MSDNIFSERFYGHREPAWHGLGVVNDKKQGAVETYSMLTPYTLEKRPMYVWMSETAGVPQDFVQTDRMAIVRGAVPDDPIERIFGVVSQQYQIVSPQEVCEVFDKVSQGGNVETMGSLGLGEKFFITMKADEIVVKGDKSQSYLFLASPYEPGQAICLIRTNVRVVCANTWQAAQSAGRWLWKGNHNNSDLKTELEIWLEHSIAEALGQSEATTQFMKILAEYDMNKKKVYEALFQIYPNPEEIPANYPKRLIEKAEEHYQYEKQIAGKRRDAVEYLFDGKGTGMDAPACKGTAFGLFQSVVEYEDYKRGGSDVTESVVMGDRARAKSRAGEVLLFMARKAL